MSGGARKRAQREMESEGGFCRRSSVWSSMRYSLKGFQCQSFPDSNRWSQGFPSQIFSLFRWSQGILSHKLESLALRGKFFMLVKSIFEKKKERRRRGEEEGKGEEGRERKGGVYVLTSIFSRSLQAISRPSPPLPLSSSFLLPPTFVPSSLHTLCRVHTVTATPVSRSLRWQLNGDLTHDGSLIFAPPHPSHPLPYPLHTLSSSFLPHSYHRHYTLCRVHTVANHPRVPTGITIWSFSRSDGWVVT